jgi:hypothetical protein
MIHPRLRLIPRYDLLQPGDAVDAMVLKTFLSLLKKLLRKVCSAQKKRAMPLLMR